MNKQDRKGVNNLVCVLCFSEQPTHLADFIGTTPGMQGRAHEIMSGLHATIAYCDQCVLLGAGNPIAYYWRGVIEERVRIANLLGLPSRVCTFNPRPIDLVTKGEKN